MPWICDVWWNHQTIEEKKKKSREKKVAKQLQKSQNAVNKMAILSPYLPKLTKFSRILQNFFQETIKNFK